MGGGGHNLPSPFPQMSSDFHKYSGKEVNQYHMTEYSKIPSFYRTEKNKTENERSGLYKTKKEKKGKSVSNYARYGKLKVNVTRMRSSIFMTSYLHQ